MTKIRKPAWAGQFYPGRPEQLEKMVHSFLAAAPEGETTGTLFGLVSPHAGYIYSGSTAAAGYRLVSNMPFDTVVVLSPSHGQYIRGVSLFDGDAYQTPLGQIPVDREITRQLAASSPLLQLSDIGHTNGGERAEHALEVQLPFLQCALQTSFKLVAAVFHDYKWEVCKALGEGLAAIYHQRMLVIASSDLYHGPSYESCKHKDALTLQGITAGNAEAFCRGFHRSAFEACGAGPISALLHAAHKLGASDIRVQAQTNSADVTGERGDYVVGYAAVSVGWPAA